MADPFENPFHEGFDARKWDIVNDYDWTSSPAGSKLRSQAPNAYVTAYKMDFAQLSQFIDGYINIASSSARAEELGTNPGLQFYKDMYNAGTILADINFPFFGDSIRGFTSEYANTFSPISQRAGTFLFGDTIEKMGAGAESAIGGAIALGRTAGNFGGNAIADKVAGAVGYAGDVAGDAFQKFTGKKLPGLQTVGAPGSYIETPMFYQYSPTDANVDIEFVLSNTLNDYRGNKGFKENKKFIKEFTMMNRPYRYGPIEMTFPAIYHLEIPGLRYIEWAFLENFGIQLIGTRRRIGRDIIPEAYGFKFSFKSLTIEAANFVLKTDQVEAFDEGDANYIQLRQKADEGAVARAAASKAEADRIRRQLHADDAAAQAEKDRLEKERLENERYAGETDAERRTRERAKEDAELNASPEAKQHASEEAQKARLEKARLAHTERMEAIEAQRAYDEVKGLEYDKDRPDLDPSIFKQEKADLLATMKRESAEAELARFEAQTDPLSRTDIKQLGEQGELTEGEVFRGGFSGEDWETWADQSRVQRRITPESDHSEESGFQDPALGLTFMGDKDPAQAERNREMNREIADRHGGEFDIDYFEGREDYAATERWIAESEPNARDALSPEARALQDQRRQAEVQVEIDANQAADARRDAEIREQNPGGNRYFPSEQEQLPSWAPSRHTLPAASSNAEPGGSGIIDDHWNRAAEGLANADASDAERRIRERAKEDAAVEAAFKAAEDPVNFTIPEEIQNNPEQLKIYEETMAGFNPPGDNSTDSTPTQPIEEKK